jgi:ABC-type phosphate transport system substrate-binding protein
MTYHSARRMLSACIAAVALVAALAMATAGTAGATSDLTSQCSGANIKGQGSTFQAPAQEVWNPDFNASIDTNVLGCAGNAGQGDGKKPTVTYESTGSHSGSGACLKGFGDGEAPKYEEYPYCGTDEAPSESAEHLMEANKASSDTEVKTIESIPVLQGSVAVLIHLPSGCVASDEAKVGGKIVKEGRLALDDTTVAKIYEGEIRNWKEVEEAQTDDHDKITCKGEGGKTATEEEETPINVVVRDDKSGTTHIFKSFIAQVEPEPHEFEAEEFNEINEEGVEKKNPCGTVIPAGPKPWKAVQEGCENQRWPLKAKVVRPLLKGNPGVVGEVNSKASSIGYADLSVARKEGFFSKKCVSPVKAPECGGENKKGSATKLGEQNHRFWVPIQNSAVAGEEYADPANNQDLEKADASNCANTKYVGKIGEVIPPVNTREPWSTVKAQLVQVKYPICGLTYDLALREYKPYILPHGGSPAEEEKGKEVAQTTRDYLLWELSTKTQGGGYVIKDHDYEKVSGTVLKEAEAGVKEIGWEKP